MKTKHISLEGASAANSAYSTNSNMQYNQYQNIQGHGWAAEDANAMDDILRGRKVEKVGMNNSGDGADRIVNGVKIQTKYCRTAKATINAAFQNGHYRYEGMKLEVPKDQYKEAIKLMEDKIRQGEVEGINDPSVAKDIIKEGHYTYDQARNIAKAGTVDSLKFDVKTQAITCTWMTLMSGALTYAQCRRNGMSNKEALKKASLKSVETGGTTMLVGVGTQQLLRTEVGYSINRAVTDGAIDTINGICKSDFGRQAVQKTASFLTGKSLSEEAAKRVFTKGASANIITASAMLAIQTVPDAIKVAKGKMSAGQFTENLASNTAGIGGGYGGASVGAAIGSLACPGVGTVIGGIVGGIAGGIAGSSAVRGIAKLFK